MKEIKGVVDSSVKKITDFEKQLNDLVNELSIVKGVTDKVTKIIEVKYALDKQDEKDRQSIALWGAQERNTLPTKDYLSSGKDISCVNLN